MANEFKLIILGILIQAAPFVAVSTLLFFLIEVFFPRLSLSRLFGKNKPLGVLAAALLGVILPVPECCIVLFARRLMDRGAGMPAALTFMVASPSLNFIVIASTGVAFATMPHVIWWRFALAGAIVLIMGGIFLYIDRGAHETLPESAPDAANARELPGMGERAKLALDRAVDDFIKMMGFLVIAAAAVSLIHVVFEDSIQAFGAHQYASIPVAALFGFVTSAGSDADAFVANSLPHFPAAAMLAFMLLGPVIDLKLVLAQSALLPARARKALWTAFPLLVLAAVAVFRIFG